MPEVALYDVEIAINAQRRLWWEIDEHSRRKHYQIGVSCNCPERVNLLAALIPYDQVVSDYIRSVDWSKVKFHSS